MNKYALPALLLASLVFILQVNLYCQGAFEGRIELKVPGTENSGDLSYYKKGNKIRINAEGKQRNSDLIIDPDREVKILLMTQMNKYVLFPFSDGDFRHNTGEKALKNFRKTGETKNINGYSCNEWVYRFPGGKINAWLTGGLGTFRFFIDPMKNESEPGWETEIENSELFPMSIYESLNGGESVILLNVKAVKKRKLRDDYFIPPADFEVMKKPNMDSMKNFMQKN